MTKSRPIVAPSSLTYGPSPVALSGWPALASGSVTIAGGSSALEVASSRSSCSSPRSSSASKRFSPSIDMSASYRRTGICSPKDKGPKHPDDVDQDDVEDHRLRRRGPHPNRPARGGVAVVAPDQHDRGRHEHPLDQAEDQVGRVLEHPEDQFVA